MDSIVTLLHGKKLPSHKQIETGKSKRICVDDVPIGREIGRGEFGTVYEANWVTERLKVAVKIVDGTKGQCDIQVFLGLNHRNLVRTFGIISTDSWIIMELSTHGNLLQCLTKRSLLSATRLHSWINDLICGIIFLHDNEIVHKNLKSLNCLIFDSCLKISDALTSQRSFEKIDDYLDSNVPWMAPEVLGDPTRTSTMSDVYSIGIIVNEILSGKQPYADYTNTTRQLMRKIIHADLRPTVHDDCGSELKTLLQMTWRKESSVRPTANEFLRLFQRSYMTSPTHAKDVRISSVARRLFLDTKDSTYNIKCLHIVPSGYPVISCMRQTSDHVYTKLLVYKSDYETKTLHESSSESDEQQVHICTSIATNSAIYALCLESGQYKLMKFDLRGNNVGKVVLRGLFKKLDTLHHHGLACDSLEFIYVITCQAGQPYHALVKYSQKGKQCGEITLDRIPFPTWIDIKSDILWAARHNRTCTHRDDNVIGAFDLQGNPLTSIINPSLVCKYDPFVKNFCLAVSANGFLIVSDYKGNRYVLNYQGTVLYLDCREHSNVLYGNMAIIDKKYLVQQTWNKQGFPDIIQYYNLLADYKF